MRILVLYDSTYGDSFYDGFCDELCKLGNTIKYFNFNNNYDNADIIEALKDYKAELAIIFNYACPEIIIKKLPKKRIVYDIDTPENILNKKNFIKSFKHSKNIYYASVQKDFKKYLKKVFNCIKNFDRCFYLPFATTFKNDENILSKYNIFFCGTNWNYNFDILKKYDNFELLKIYKNLKKDYFCENENKKIFKDLFLIKWNLSGLERVDYLSQLSDLGLIIYGDKWNELYHNFDVLKCVVNKKIVNLNELNYCYNSSKININISHLQSKTSFSIRVMDIMATNGCLLCEYKKELIELFGQYLSQNTIDKIFFKNKFELRQKAIYLLNNDKERTNIVKELNNAVENNGRWLHRFKTIESIMNINLHNNDFISCSPLINAVKRNDIKIIEKKKTIKNKIFKVFFKLIPKPLKNYFINYIKNNY